MIPECNASLKEEKRCSWAQGHPVRTECLWRNESHDWSIRNQERSWVHLVHIFSSSFGYLDTQGSVGRLKVFEVYDLAASCHVTPNAGSHVCIHTKLTTWKWILTSTQAENSVCTVISRLDKSYSSDLLVFLPLVELQKPHKNDRKWENSLINLKDVKLIHNFIHMKVMGPLRQTEFSTQRHMMPRLGLY